MPSLLETQRAVRRAICLGDDAALQDLVDGPGRSAAARIGIHRNTAVVTLVRALRLSYPGVQSLVGAEFFEGAARLFLEECWPQGALLDDFGAQFAPFLASFDAAASLPYLGDVARVEWAVKRALHASDAPALDLQRLAQVAARDGGNVRFVPDPSLALLNTNWPADEIWRAVIDADDEAMAAIDLVALPRWLIAQRAPDGSVDLRRLSRAQWEFTQMLFAGLPLEHALASAADDDVDFEAQAWLAQLLAAGRFVDFALDIPIRP